MGWDGRVSDCGLARFVSSRLLFTHFSVYHLLLPLFFVLFWLRAVGVGFGDGAVLCTTGDVCEVRLFVCLNM